VVSKWYPLASGEFENSNPLSCPAEFIVWLTVTSKYKKAASRAASGEHLYDGLGSVVSLFDPMRQGNRIKLVVLANAKGGDLPRGDPGAKGVSTDAQDLHDFGGRDEGGAQFELRDERRRCGLCHAR
jgi:hypothetical protein